MTAMVPMDMLEEIQGWAPAGGFVRSEWRKGAALEVGHLFRHAGWSVITASRRGCHHGRAGRGYRQVACYRVARQGRQQRLADPVGLRRSRGPHRYQDRPRDVSRARACELDAGHGPLNAWGAVAGA